MRLLKRILDLIDKVARDVEEHEEEFRSKASEQDDRFETAKRRMEKWDRTTRLIRRR